MKGEMGANQDTIVLLPVECSEIGPRLVRDRITEGQRWVRVHITRLFVASQSSVLDLFVDWSLGLCAPDCCRDEVLRPVFGGPVV